MSFLIALGLIIGIVSGVISLYEFFKSHKLPGTIYGVVAVGMVLAAFLVSILPSLSGRSASGVTPVATSSNTQQETVITSTPTQPIQAPTFPPSPTLQITPTSIPTATPTPIPYSVSKTGDVCKPPYSQFQASGWVSEKNSFVFTGNGSNVVISPCNIMTPNYSVTATITLFKGQLGVGVIVHADSGGQTGYAGGSGCRNISFGKCGFFINDYFGDIMGIDQEDENLIGQTHTYKLVVNEVMLQLFYDNSTIPIVSKSLATYPQAGYAGFECYDQCQITGYTVTGI
jgi:hypothetical protein